MPQSSSSNSNNQQLWERAQKVLPGGVNSPVRAFRSVGLNPVFIDHAEGCYLFDKEGKKYIDFIGSWGPMIAGHTHPVVVKAIQEAALKGSSFGACSEAEVLFAEEVCSRVPSLEMVRMVNSGTEATMSAVRLARGYTSREKIIKFRGCYHGHGDSFLIEAGSGAATFGVPSSAGVTKGAAQDTLIADYNNLKSVQNLFENNLDQIAAIILEPVCGNMGVVAPTSEFLQGLRTLCDINKTVLIFDEVMTGFRLSRAGAEGRYGVRPDLCTFGKIIGGGLPVGGYGGRKDIMQCVSPLGSVYQAGTLSGNPLAMAAGLATFSLLTPEFYTALEEKCAQFIQKLNQFIEKHQLPCSINAVGSMFTLFFSKDPVTDWNSATLSNTQLFNQFFKICLDNGLYIAPSQFEALFISSSHSEEDLNYAQRIFEKALLEIYEI